MYKDNQCSLVLKNLEMNDSLRNCIVTNFILHPFHSFISETNKEKLGLLNCPLCRGIPLINGGQIDVRSADTVVTETSHV